MTRIVAILCLAALGAGTAAAQTTRSAKSTRQAYGARLDAAAQPNDVNTARLNNRIDNRLQNRLSLRIERYRVGQTADPASAFRTPQDDGARKAPVTPPPPPEQDAN